MINKRLIHTVAESKKYIAGNVAFQWFALLGNIAMMTAIANLLASLYAGGMDHEGLTGTAAVILVALLVRFGCTLAASRMSFLSSKPVKRTLREMIYQKLLRLGAAYNRQVQTSEVVQVAVEGIDQLETYFGAYLPQFFYAMLAPLTLFAYLSFVDIPAAVVLLVCVPLIPIAIAAVQTWAKKLLANYWGQYTTTLKIYQADAMKNEEMNDQAERFRRITMKVLTMQLNSITIMDLIAYGGAALGMVMACTRYKGGYVDLSGCLLIILLSADFFIPMRQLGSFFHVAMNGMAASDKIFRLLNLPEAPPRAAACPAEGGIICKALRYSYEPSREVLHGVDLNIPQGSFTAIVGESGCGKSTIAAILMGRVPDYRGTAVIGGKELRDIREESLMEHITYVGHQSYLFKGTVGDALRMGRPGASDAELWAVLERVKLADFLRGVDGLETAISEKGGNLSGGQCQRLALARALLYDSPVYIFDEATSNIDVESENDIMAEIHASMSWRMASWRKAGHTGLCCRGTASTRPFGMPSSRWSGI